MMQKTILSDVYEILKNEHLVSSESEFSRDWLGRSEPPHFYWSMFMFRKRRTTNGKQASEAGGYYHKVAAS